VDGMKPDLKFGDLILNESASAGNPHRLGYVYKVEHSTGRINPGWHILCTDGKGKYWSLSTDAEIKKLGNIFDRNDKLEEAGYL
jgi:hypothetical protein